MALESTKDTPGKTKPVGIFTLRMANRYRPGYQPAVKSVEVTSETNRKSTTFKTAKPYRELKNECNEYLVSVELEPGDYVVKHVAGDAVLAGGLLVQGNFNFPANAHFTLPSTSIVYLGQVEMVNRERKPGEKRAGSIFLLIDQSITGFSGGTFDVKVSDQSETDIPAFRSAYPSLTGLNIEKAIMR